MEMTPKQKHDYEHCSGPTKPNPMMLPVRPKPITLEAMFQCGNCKYKSLKLPVMLKDISALYDQKFGTIVIKLMHCEHKDCIKWAAAELLRLRTLVTGTDG